ncbi:hypothetical protein [Qipengyuania sp. MTN3-11]|uniref:hypothetical protein n=1 Tax=Qipengyuania sp. MTN3-11 TaxID=3056557 RepID=UPI0036F2534E
MDDIEPLKTRRMMVGLVCGSLVGLLCYISLEAATDLLTQLIAREFLGFESRDLHIFETVWIFALFGAPVAIFMGLLVGLPVWKVAEGRPLRSKRSALIYGAIAGAFIGLIFLLLGLAIGLSTFLDDRSSYNSWSHGYQVTRDGLPTALGWLIQIKTLLFYCAAGAIGGVAARFVALPR